MTINQITITKSIEHPESCRVCGSDEVIFNRRMINGKEIQVRFCNACGAVDRL